MGWSRSDGQVVGAIEPAMPDVVPHNTAVSTDLAQCSCVIEQHAVPAKLLLAALTPYTDEDSIIDAMDPRFISCLTVTPVEGTPLHEQVQDGSFEMITPEQTLDELELLIQNLDVSKAIFRSNHASNYLPLGGRLPAEKESLLEAVAAAKRGEVGLKPEWLRGL